MTRLFLRAYPEADAIFFAAAGLVGGCRAIMNMNRAANMRVVCFDAEDIVLPMLSSGLISATISQKPAKQGSVPLELLYEYLTTGIPPAEDICIIETAIRIPESLRP